MSKQKVETDSGGFHVSDTSLPTLSWNISMKLCSIFTPLGKIQESFYTIWLPDYLHTYLHTYFFYLPSSFAVARESLIRKKLFRSKTIFIENLWIYLLLYKLQLQIFMIMTWVYLVLCNFNYKNICTQSKIGQYNI